MQPSTSVQKFGSSLSQRQKNDCYGARRCWQDEKTKKYVRMPMSEFFKIVKIILHFLDMFWDYFLAVNYYRKNDTLYGSLTLFFVLFPLIYIVHKRKVWEEYPVLKNPVYLFFYTFLGLEILVLYNSKILIYFWEKLRNLVAKRKFCRSRNLEQGESDENNNNNNEEHIRLHTIQNENHLTYEEENEMRRQKEKLRQMEIDTKLTNMLMLVISMEDLPQLTLQLGIWLQEGSKDIPQMISILSSTVCIVRVVWTWDKLWSTRNFGWVRRLLMFFKWLFPIISRVIAVAIAMSSEPHFQILAGVVLIFHLSLITLWFCFERSFMIKIGEKNGLGFKKYSKFSTFKKSLECSIVDLFTIRADKYYFDYLNINNYIRKNPKYYFIKWYINCILTSILFIAENFLITFLVYEYSNKTIQKNIWWCRSSTLLATLGAFFIMEYRYATRNNIRFPKNIFRDIGKIYEYFATEQKEDSNVEEPEIVKQ